MLTIKKYSGKSQPPERLVRETFGLSSESRDMAAEMPSGNSISLMLAFVCSITLCSVKEVLV
jgi:hypothetical protein